MTVKQLIKKLQKLDPDMNVYHTDFEGYIYLSVNVHVGYTMQGAEYEISPIAIEDLAVELEDVEASAIIDGKCNN